MPLLYKNALVQYDNQRTIPVSQVTLVNPALSAVESQLQETLRALQKKVADEARYEADQWLEEQRLELQAAMEIKGQRHYEAARQEGYQAGLAKAQAEAEQLMKEINRSYQVLETDRQAFVESCRVDIANLVATLAEHILQQELTVSKETMPAMITQAVAQLISRRHVAVFVHPSRVAALTAAFAESSIPLDIQTLLVRPDPTLNVASFRAEDELGAILVDLPEILRQLGMILL